MEGVSRKVSIIEDASSGWRSKDDRKPRESRRGRPDPPMRRGERLIDEREHIDGGAERY